jgi:hypothetical protein
LIAMSSAPATFDASRRSLSSFLLNPFRYLAGGPALIIGIAIILASGLIASFSHSHFNGVLDFHTWPDTVAVPVVIYLIEGIIDWIILALLLYMLGKALSSSHTIRALDVFGTQALARAPVLLTALAALLPGYQRSIERLGPAALSGSWSLLTDYRSDLAVFIAAVCVCLTAIIWMVALMYRAFAVSCNLKGTRAVISFTVALIASEALSVILNLALANRLILHQP